LLYEVTLTLARKSPDARPYAKSLHYLGEAIKLRLMSLNLTEAWQKSTLLPTIQPKRPPNNGKPII
jgi:hypothetical protein